MIKRPFLFIVLLAVITASEARSSDSRFITPEKIDLLRTGQSLLLNDQFREADSAYKRYSRLDPADPAGPLFLASVILARMNDAENDREAQQFKDLIKRTDSIVEQQMPLSDSADKAWLMMVKGHAASYRSIFESRFGSRLSAVKNGLSARNCYSDGVDFDSTLWDIYFGLGSYHYWKSAKGGVLRFLGILKNDRELGITELKLAADSALFSAEAARSALIWVYLNEELYDSTIAFAKLMHERHPRGRSFLWPLAAAYTEQERYGEAAEIYSLLRLYFETNPGNYYNLIEIDYALCKLAEDMDDDAVSREQAILGSSYFAKLPDKTHRRQRSKLSYLSRKAGLR